MNDFNVAAYDSGLVYARPEIFLCTAACLILLVDLLLADVHRRWIGVLAVASLLATAVLVAIQPVTERVVLLGGSFELDRMAKVLKVAVLLTVSVVFVYSFEYLRRRAIFKGEYFVLGLFATLGMLVLISAASLITVYLGLELMSLCLYAMVAFDRDSGKAAESAIKFFVLGSLASGTLLYGMSIIYGVTGSLELAEIAAALNHGLATNVGVLFGVSFIIVAVGFKFGAVPFHMWLPDVYEGSPTCVTLFVGSAPKIAAFALAMRLLTEGLVSSQADWSQMLIVLSALSLVIGNIVAIAQTNIKRMLAYSTISHVGYILLGVIAGTAQGYEAAMFYTITYVLVATGVFGILLLLSRQGFDAETLEDLRGLSSRSPWFAAMMAVFMFSLAGVPPFIGFAAKLVVIQAVVSVGYVWLAVVAILLSVVGAYYYLRIVKLMYFDEPAPGAVAPLDASAFMRTLLSLNGLAALGLGVMPESLLLICKQALP